MSREVSAKVVVVMRGYDDDLRGCAVNDDRRRRRDKLGLPLIPKLMQNNAGQKDEDDEKGDEEE